MVAVTCARVVRYVCERTCVHATATIYEQRWLSNSPRAALVRNGAVAILIMWRDGHEYVDTLNVVCIVSSTTARRCEKKTYVKKTDLSTPARQVLYRRQ